MGEMKSGYARSSTNDQTTALQLAAQRPLQRHRNRSRAAIPNLHFVLWYNNTQRINQP
jgi:hypothetical protein